MASFLPTLLLLLLRLLDLHGLVILSHCISHVGSSGVGVGSSGVGVGSSGVGVGSSGVGVGTKSGGGGALGGSQSGWCTIVAKKAKLRPALAQQPIEGKRRMCERSR